MAVKTFTTGEVLTSADTNTYLANSGLVYVTSASVSGTPSSITVSSAFNSTFDHYRIIISNLVVGTSCQIRMTLGSQITQYYYGNPLTTFAGGAYEKNFGSNVAFFDIGPASSVFSNDFNFDIMAPFVSSRTKINGFGYSNSTSFGGLGSGLVDVNTSFTAFTLTCSAGTMSAGKVDVFGYRKS
jgi:hypothetical protein